MHIFVCIFGSLFVIKTTGGVVEAPLLTRTILCFFFVSLFLAHMHTHAGLLLEGHRDAPGLRGRLEQPRLRLQCPRRNMAGHSPLREGGRPRSELP
jgi:hypothetical protein